METPQAVPHYEIKTANIDYRFYQAVCYVGDYYMQCRLPLETNHYDCGESDAADRLMAHIINATPYNARYNCSKMFHL